MGIALVLYMSCGRGGGGADTLLASKPLDLLPRGQSGAVRHKYTTKKRVIVIAK